MTATTSLPGSTRTSLGAERAFLLLRTVFTVAPIPVGLDKFTNLLTDWDVFWRPWMARWSRAAGPRRFMYIVGVVEIVAGVAVALASALRIGARGRLAAGHHHQPDHPRRLLRCRSA